jgi:hypothetical protein
VLIESAVRDRLNRRTKLKRFRQWPEGHTELHWTVREVCFVSENVPSEDDRLWSKRFKAGTWLLCYELCYVVVVKIHTLAQGY